MNSFCLLRVSWRIETRSLGGITFASRSNMTVEEDSVWKAMFMLWGYSFWFCVRMKWDFCIYLFQTTKFLCLVIRKVKLSGSEFQTFKHDKTRQDRAPCLTFFHCKTYYVYQSIPSLTSLSFEVSWRIEIMICSSNEISTQMLVNTAGNLTVTHFRACRMFRVFTSTLFWRIII